MGPTLWSTSSLVILEILRDKGFGTEFCRPISKATLHLVGFSYVDDCDLVATADTANETFLNMEGALKTWEELVAVTGGCLVPNKSSWYLVDYMWRKCNWHCIDPTDAVYCFKVTMIKGECQQLSRLQSHQAMEMLGVHLAPLGTTVPQVQVLQKASKTWAERIRVGYLKRGEVWKALQTTITKKMAYLLLAIPLSRANCKYIMAPIINYRLPRAGIPSNIPLQLCHSPMATMGFAIFDPYLEQHCQWVQTLVNHLWQDFPMG